LGRTISKVPSVSKDLTVTSTASIAGKTSFHVIRVVPAVFSFTERLATPAPLGYVFVAKSFQIVRSGSDWVAVYVRFAGTASVRVRDI
jgi:hypothetical protein